jgi:8-oxo-dGTP pyrophosphatase MutT (NUDIX family)
VESRAEPGKGEEASGVSGAAKRVSDEAAGAPEGGANEGEASALLREQIRARLAAAPPIDPKASLLAQAEGPLSPALLALLEAPSREAAVLVGLIERPAGPTVLLTERAAHLKHHPGQVCFPGGRLAGPEGVVRAALREAWEEVRLAPSAVDVAGRMSPQITGTGFCVTPVVGFIAADFEPQPDPREVAAVFEVPLAVVRAPGAFAPRSRERFGTRFTTYELHYEGHYIWGATATMLRTFVEVVLRD